MAKIETYVLATSPLSFSDMLIGTEIDGPIPNATKNFSLQELYGLFATMPITGNLQQVLDTGNTATQDIVLTGDIASTTITPQYIVDGLASTGAVGEVLTRAVGGMSWAPPTIQNLQSVLNSGSTATSNMSLVGDFTSTKIIPGNIQDYLGNTGSTGQVLYKSVSGLLWANLPAATIPTLQQVLDAGFSATANIILTGTINTTNIKPTSITDELNATGTVGQVLTRSSTGIRWDSLNFVNTVTATSPITSTGGYNPIISSSMNTNKLIGRSTAGTGVMEEISIGSGLSLSGGVLTSTGGGGGSGLKSGIATGTDTYAVTISGVTSYADGDAYLIRFTNGNTTGATLNINSLGAKTLYRNNDGVLIGGDIEDGSEMLCVYNTTLNGFQVIGTSPNSLISYVTNDDSVTITKGQPVYAFSGQGDRLTVKLANNTTDAASAQTIGLVMSSSIAPNQKGFIMMQGLLDGLSILPTATWSDGDPVYLGATAGTITNVKPSAPNHLVYLGFVTTASNGSAGRLYVRVQNGYELQELHNVALTNPPSNNDGLFYESSTSLWKNKSIATVLGYTPQAQLTNPVTGTGVNNEIAYFNTTGSTIGSLSTATYPSLTELSYVKGVTSAIQTQLNGKQASGNYLTEDPVILAQQAMGSTIKGVCLAARSFRDLVGGLQPVSGTLYLTAYYLNQSATITGVKFYQSVGGIFTANNFNGFALYTYSGGVLTQVAITANDGNNWKFTSGTTPSIPFTSPYSASTGLYFIGGIYSTSAVTTAPIMGHGGAKITTGAANADFTNNSRFTATLSSQTSMPSSITLSTTTALTTNIAFYLY